MTLISFAYNPVSGDPEDISQVMANFNSIRAVVNGQLDDSNLAAAAGIQLTKLGQAGATVGQAMVWDGVKWAPGSPGGAPAGVLITYDSFNSDVVIGAGATGEGSAQTVKVTTSKVYDGTTPISIEFFSPKVAMNGAASITLMLLRDGTVIAGAFGTLDGASQVKTAMRLSMRDGNTGPPAGSHTYTVKAYVTSGAGGTIGAGSGGSGNEPNGYIRVYKDV